MQPDHSNGMAQGYPAAAPLRGNPYAPQPTPQSTGGVGGVSDGNAPGFEVLTHMLLRTLQNWPTLPQIAVPSDDDAPVLQVLSVKKMTGAEGQNNPTDRHRFIVSDGVHYAQAMIATHLNELIFSQAFSKNNLIRLRGLKSNFVNEKRVLIITDCVPMSHGAGHLPRLGWPIMEIGNLPTSLPPTFDPARATAVATQIIERFSSTAGVPGAGLPSQQAVENGGMAGAAPQYRPPAPQQPAPQQPAPSPYAQQSPYQGSMGGAQQGTSRMQAGPGGMSSSSSSSTEAPAVVLPIRALTPYQQKWTIRASVVQKSEIRTFTNKNGEGKLFSVIFADESGEIRATGFGDTVTMFYDMLIEGHVYFVSMASVKVAKKQFSGAVQNEYEMTFESRTSIMPCNDSIHTAIRFERVMLSDLMSREKDATIDVLGVVKEVQDVSHFVSKTTNKPLVKRDILIVDESRYSVRTTLWGRQAETFVTESSDPHPVVLVKGVRVGDFGGRSLSCAGGSTVLINPDIPDAHRVRGWYDSPEGPGGAQVELMTYSMSGIVSASATGSFGASGMGGGAGGKDFKTFAKVDEDGLGHNEKPDYFSVRGATVCIVRDKSLYYPACQSQDCNKKVIETDSGWRCEKCAKYYPAPLYRYIASALFCDFTGQQWVQLFNESAEVLFGKTADELNKIMEENEDAFKAYLHEIYFRQFNMRVRAKAEVYNGESRVRLTCTTLEPINYAAGAHELVELINAFGV